MYILYLNCLRLKNIVKKNAGKEKVRTEVFVCFFFNFFIFLVVEGSSILSVFQMCTSNPVSFPFQR